MNSLAEGRLRGLLGRLERMPPADQLIGKLRPLKWPVLFLAGLATADLAMMGLGAYFDTGKAPPPAKPRVVLEAPYVKNVTAYEPIISRNAFCPGCPVPDMKIRAMERPKDCNKATPMTTNLKLIGTIVLSDPKYSVATISDGGPESSALLVGDNFKNDGRVLEIRRTRVCFLRPDNSLGFIEIPEEAIKVGQPLPNALPTSSSEGITRTADTDFSVKKSFLNERLNDPGLLTQAYAIPSTCPDGSRGFKVMSVNPGSVYEALGIQAGDCITGMDGAPMDSIARAQEAYMSLRTRDQVAIDVIRNGSPVTMSYKIK